MKDGEVVIVDELTGRLMYGRRYSDGIHQAMKRRKASRFAARTERRDDYLPKLLPLV